MCEPQTMTMNDKFWYIKDHWNEYEKHIKDHGGSAVGFPFPDGSKVESTDDDLVVY